MEGKEEEEKERKKIVPARSVMTGAVAVDEANGEGPGSVPAL